MNNINIKYLVLFNTWRFYRESISKTFWWIGRNSDYEEYEFDCVIFIPAPSTGLRSPLVGVESIH